MPEDLERDFEFAPSRDEALVAELHRALDRAEAVAKDLAAASSQSRIASREVARALLDVIDRAEHRQEPEETTAQKGGG